jgi:hypothetical protein
MLQAKFSKIFRSKNEVIGPVQIPKRKFVLIFFSSISLGRTTGTKGEKLNFYSSNIHNSPFGTIFFWVFVPVQRSHF